jgi:phosphate ABC transporter phosphate-binding protein
VALAITALAAMCAAILAPAQPASAGLTAISGAGSTWSYNAIHQWTSQVAANGIVVNYAPVGSTSGRSEFGQGTVDFGASEIPYGVRDGDNYDPPPSRGYAYMPDTAGGTTFMYNLTVGNSRITDLRLSGAVIAGIFTGVITMWNDSRIKADNPGLNLPAIGIVPVVRADGSGATAEFTQWMIATQGPYWTAYCAKVGRNPCTQTSAYPVLPGSAMRGQPGDLGVSGFVSQPQADGAIGYVEYSYAKQTGFPVAKVLNAAGYYTEPTPGHVAVSLLKAQINNNPSDPLYLTQDLSQVYTDSDPRTYELSSYSYMILPTTTQGGFSSDKGYTLGLFGKYLLCQGQANAVVDTLGYSSLPLNLVEAGFAQLRRIPGAQVPLTNSQIYSQCPNPTFTSNGTNQLANTDPYPPSCDKQGAAMCTTGTGGAPGNSGGNGNGGNGHNSGNNGNNGTSGPGGTNSPGGTHGPGGSNSPGGTSTGGNSGTPTCDPTTGICTTPGSGTNSNGTSGLAGSGQVNGSPVSSPTSLGDGLQVVLMALAAALLVGLGLGPALIAQSGARRRRRNGTGPPPGPYDRGDWR